MLCASPSCVLPSPRPAVCCPRLTQPVLPHNCTTVRLASRRRRWVVALACLASAHAFACTTGRLSIIGRQTSRGTVRLLAKGFGKPQPQKSAPKPRKPSEGQQRRDKAAADFDALKATGAPEYMISVRTVGADGPSDWMPVGGLAVPRSNSVDTAVSMAIFQNEDELLKGAFRAFPRLKTSTDKFEYGFRLRAFPDDEIKIASQDKTKESTNPLMQWFNQLDSPLNKG